MKTILTLYISLFISLLSFGQDDDSYIKMKLKEGYPNQLETIKQHSNVTLINSVLLETGLDSVDIYIGESFQCGKKGYWLSIFLNDSLNSFCGISLEKDSILGVFSNDINTSFPFSKNFSLRLIHNSENNEVSYMWLNKNKKSDKLIFLDSIVEKILAKNKKFPFVKFETINGKEVTTDSFKDKIVIINWWNTGCGPCVKEIPDLNVLVEKYKTNSNIIFLAIAKDSKVRLERFLRNKEFNYIQAIGDDKLSKTFGLIFPTNIVIDPNGIISFYKEGSSVGIYKLIESEIEILLNKN